MSILQGPFRWEEDSLGRVKVPRKAYYGAQTQRAIDNFPISGLRFQRDFIRSLGLIKHAAARTNADLKRLERSVARVIEKAAREVMEG